MKGLAGTLYTSEDGFYVHSSWAVTGRGQSVEHIHQKIRLWHERIYETEQWKKRQLDRISRG